MLLAIDVGNSNVVIGCLDGKKVISVFRLLTTTLKTEDEYAVGIKNVLDFGGIPISELDGAIISCVVPPLTGVFRSAVKRLTGLDALVVGAGIRIGMNILIDDPAQLGSDMVAAGVAAIAEYELPAIIIDLGTATKVFVVNQNAGFMGGCIFPGVALAMNALTRGTSQLPKVPIEAPAKYISANTIDCMKSGAVFGNAAMIDGMIDRYEEELGTKASIVATGGLASVIHPHCRHDITFDPDLILHGLALIYEKNKKK